MSHPSHRQTAFWLIVSAALLSTLIPGGPIENRDFSHIHVGVLGAFNIFLTVLDLGSIVIVYFAFRGRSWAFQAAFLAAISFFGVYAVDLAQIFPRSPTPMSFSLALIEVPSDSFFAEVPRTAACVVQVDSIENTLAGASALGLECCEVRREPAPARGPARAESAFYDYESRPVVIFELLGDDGTAQ